MTPPRVDVVCIGSIARDGFNIVEAHSTCTLVRTKKHVMLVDTSDRAYRQRLLDGLAGIGVAPEEVDILVNTHSHSDHNSNNRLFTNATLYSHVLDPPPSPFQAMQGVNLEIDEKVRLVHTPGHSPGSISVFVDAEARTVIAGDAIPTQDNYLKDVPPAHHTDLAMAVESMHRIISWADRVVPGHGPMFVVKH
ncbi:MAG: Hydroxyacylglutathione hydrolase [Methanomassiliicoccales archaeon PtaU1.Bin124]|nr:MAG: Hydroxyacylglutathione hydrolase [Methanomassiliicoccales archaeon PtaU1.Bin124]